MAFERTLRMVQIGRAATTISACISIIFFAFVIKLRSDARYKFLKELTDAHPDIFDIGEPSHGTWGGVALGGVSWVPLDVQRQSPANKRVACSFGRLERPLLY